MFGMFSFAFQVLKALKCEAVNFLKFELAGIPVRSFKYFGVPILLIACVPCMYAHDVHAHHGITRFTYDVKHVTKMSPAFAFHLCYIGMRWHDVIGVHIARTPHCHGSHCMGIT